jgi:transposase
MPGWGRRSGRDALPETGPDMSRFPTGAHLACRAGRTPLDNQSGKRHGKAKAKKGNRYLAAVTGETAIAAGKTQTRKRAPSNPGRLTTTLITGGRPSRLRRRCRAPS